MRRFLTRLQLACRNFQVPIIKPFFVNDRYLQCACRKPLKYFAIPMKSGQLGIMRSLKHTFYSDFGRCCCAINYDFTGFYMEK